MTFNQESDYKHHVSNVCNIKRYTIIQDRNIWRFIGQHLFFLQVSPFILQLVHFLYYIIVQSPKYQLMRL